MATTESTAIATPRTTWRHYLELTKPKVVLLIVFTGIVGTLLSTPGDARDRVFIVLGGRLRVYLADDERELTLAFLEAGDVYATHTPTFVRTVSACTLLMLDTPRFAELLQRLGVARRHHHRGAARMQRVRGGLADAGGRTQQPDHAALPVTDLRVQRHARYFRRKASVTSPSRMPNLLITALFSITRSSISSIQSSKSRSIVRSSIATRSV